MKRIAFFILTIAACNGATVSPDAAPDAGGATAEPGPSSPPSLPPESGPVEAGAPTGPDFGPAPLPDAPTYFTGLGFDVRDANVRDYFSPTGNRDMLGLAFTEFQSACTQASAAKDARVILVTFPPDVTELAVGEYTLGNDGPTPGAWAEVLTVIAAGCTGAAFYGGQIVSGKIKLTRVDDTEVEGTLEGTHIGAGASSSPVKGKFVAARCANGYGACRY